jgi:hypothetical protein
MSWFGLEVWCWVQQRWYQSREPGDFGKSPLSLISIYSSLGLVNVHLGDELIKFN